MNRPSRTEEPEGDGYNQSPNHLSNDLTTNQDLNGISNSRELRRENSLADQNAGLDFRETGPAGQVIDHERKLGQQGAADSKGVALPDAVTTVSVMQAPLPSRRQDGAGAGGKSSLARVKNVLLTFGKFVGPGFMIAVAYIDPGNYSTDIAAGATYRFRLLFVVLMSNLFAIVLQSLSIKLGTVSGLNLAEACRAFLPRWLNYVLYVFAEVAIIATDMAEVIGFAIALNLLSDKIPLVAGCAISIVDVFIILYFYRPNGSMRGLRVFEVGVMLLVLAVVVCFCVQLSLIQNTTVGEVFQGYLPSKYLVESQALYQACGILGATVMPHSLYLGSGIVQSRLREFDTKSGLLPPTQPPQSSSSSAMDGEPGTGDQKAMYIPSLAAIRHSLKYSVAECAISLFTFALFVNSAILIVAGASLWQNPDALDSDIFGIHDLLSTSLNPAAGTIFALALLLSGVSAGVVCTIAGQMVSEGALNWTLKPWLRRLVTRSISITPSIIVAGAVGRPGLDSALQASQVALSVVLPFVSAPLIYFTCFSKFMTVQPGMARYGVHAAGVTVRRDEEAAEAGNAARAGPPAQGSSGLFRAGVEKGLGLALGRRRAEAVPGSNAVAEDGPVNMANSWWLALAACIIWVIIVAMNVANLVLLGLGRSN